MYPQLRDWYCFEYWMDGRRAFPFTSVCKRTKELCEEAQVRMRQPGLSMATCSLKDKAFCMRMRIHVQETEYLVCSETWYQCTNRKFEISEEPENFQPLSDCDERD